MSPDHTHDGRGPDGVRWAGIIQLSEYLGGKSVHTLRKMAQQDRLPHYRLGRQLLFDLDEVDEVIRTRRSLLLKRKPKKEDASGGTDEVPPSNQTPEVESTPAERAEADRIATDIWSAA